MANLFRGRLARTEGAHFAKEERRLVRDAAERLRRAAGAEAAARRGAIARAAAANAPAPTVDVLPEVRACVRAPGAGREERRRRRRRRRKTRRACPERSRLAATGGACVG